MIEEIVVMITLEMVMLIKQVTNTRKTRPAHPSRAITVVVILIEISGSQTIIMGLTGLKVLTTHSHL